MKFILYRTHAGPAENPPWADPEDIVDACNTMAAAELVRYHEGQKQAGKSGRSSLGIHAMSHEEWREIERERRGG